MNCRISILRIWENKIIWKDKNYKIIKKVKIDKNVRKEYILVVRENG